MIATERQASNWELRPIQAAADRYDVSILGGGLAGLTLAIQLKTQSPRPTLLVEKRDKSLRKHIQLRRVDCSLRRPLLRRRGRHERPSGGEAHPQVWLAVLLSRRRQQRHQQAVRERPCFCIHLIGTTRSISRAVRERLAYPRACERARPPSPHLCARRQLRRGCLMPLRSARWIKTAPCRPVGRGCLGTREPAEAPAGTCQGVNKFGNEKGGLDIEEFGAADLDGMARPQDVGPRQLSTNHLFGEGYWVWLIPLALGSISIGVCAELLCLCVRGDQPARASTAMARRARSRSSRRQLSSRLHDIQDFLRVEDFAYGVERVLSP